MSRLPSPVSATAVGPARHHPWVVSGFCCALVLFAFAIAEEIRGGDQLWHWFIVPVFLGGCLAFEDALKWLRGEVDVLDPVGVLGMFGVHFFFLAPLLHVSLNYWMDEVQPPPDWRPWLGGMATLNLLGLLIYRWTRAKFETDSQPRSKSPKWRLDAPRFQLSLLLALPLALLLQCLVYLQYGGVLGYIQAVAEGEHAFLGVSRIATIAESFPILLLIGYCFVVVRQRRTPSLAELIAVLTVFVAIKLLFGGLHGSRSNIVYAAFWAIGILHLSVRPLQRKWLLGGAVVLVGFVYLYGFYKSEGIEGLQIALESNESRAALEQEIRRPIEGTLLGDFGRSDVQAYLLYRLSKDDSDYEYALGRTYFGALITVIPGPLWRDRPPTKVKEGTEALLGRGAYRERPLSATQEADRFDGMSSKVYGLAGEGMLNFGPLAVPLVFALLGVVVGITRRCLAQWSIRDSRRFLLPLMVNFCFVVLIGDSDNLIALLEEDALFPVVLLAFASRRFVDVPVATSSAARSKPATGLLALPNRQLRHE